MIINEINTIYHSLIKIINIYDIERNNEIIIKLEDIN